MLKHNQYLTALMPTLVLGKSPSGPRRFLSLLISAPALHEAQVRIAYVCLLFLKTIFSDFCQNNFLNI